MAKGLLSTAEQFFWTLIWIFLILIIGYAVLAFAHNKFGGNFLGNIADWVSAHAQPQN